MNVEAVPAAAAVAVYFTGSDDYVAPGMGKGQHVQNMWTRQGDGKRKPQPHPILRRRWPFCVWIDASRRGLRELNTLHKRRQRRRRGRHMTNDDRPSKGSRVDWWRGWGGGVGNSGTGSAVDWVKASFSELCACWFKKIIKDIFVVLMSLPRTFFRMGRTQNIDWPTSKATQVNSRMRVSVSVCGCTCVCVLVKCASSVASTNSKTGSSSMFTVDNARGVRSRIPYHARHPLENPLAAAMGQSWLCQSHPGT